MRVPLRLVAPATAGLAGLALLCTALFGARHSPSYGATIIVSNNSDSGPGSLRQALADAHDGDTVQFDASLSGRIITLTSGELVVNKSITISGPGPGLLWIMRDHQAPGFRLFHVQETTTVLIQGLHITGGYATVGGGILDENNTGFLTISDCFVEDNRAGSPTPGPVGTPTPTGTPTTARGGGVATSGAGGAGLVIRDCIISSNTAPGSGSGILLGSSNSTVTISNSTIANNGISTSGTQQMVEISNSTISSGDIYNNCIVEVTNSTLNNSPIDNFGTVRLADTILNSSSIANSSGVVTSQGYNISSDDGGGFLNAPGDQINTDPMLGPLHNNGGLTPTHALLPGSPAIDLGNPNFNPPPFTDQRGYVRVYNRRIDIGSYEVEPAQALNLSTRLLVLTDDNVGIGGFIVTGTEPKQVVIEGIGPSLGDLPPPNRALADPSLELHGLPTPITNDNWRDGNCAETPLGHKMTWKPVSLQP